MASSPAVSELYWGKKALHVCMKIANLGPRLGRTSSTHSGWLDESTRPAIRPDPCGLTSDPAGLTRSAGRIGPPIPADRRTMLIHGFGMRLSLSLNGEVWMGRDYYCKLVHAEELIWFLGCLNDEFQSCSFLNSHPSIEMFPSNHRDVLHHGAGRTSIIS